MKSDKLIPGLVLVLLGITFLLRSFGIIDFDWGNIIHLWPILIIIAGVNLVFANNRTPLAIILKISVVLLGFCLLVFGSFNSSLGIPYTYSSTSSSDDDDKDDDSVKITSGIVKVEGTDNFSAPYTSDAHNAKLNISGGVSSYALSDTTSQLFTANASGVFGKYLFTHGKADSIYVLDFKMQDHKGFFNWGNHNKSNSVNFKLNPNPVWDIRVESGATALNFDLSKFKVQSFILKGGAGSYDVKLGQPLERTDVNISAGASSVDLTIPDDAACDIESNTGLASNSFNGFDKQDDGHYQTPGFATAKNKMYITISGGMGSFDVHRGQ